MKRKQAKHFTDNDIESLKHRVNGWLEKMGTHIILLKVEYSVVGVKAGAFPAFWYNTVILYEV